MARKPQPSDGLPEGTYIWLVWGLTKDRCDLLATASSEAAKARYIEVGQRRGYKTVHTEYIMVDHMYGDRMLGSLRSIRALPHDGKTQR